MFNRMEKQTFKEGELRNKIQSIRLMRQTLKMRKIFGRTMKNNNGLFKKYKNLWDFQVTPLDEYMIIVNMVYHTLDEYFQVTLSQIF